jgi:hypothetical protein
MVWRLSGKLAPNSTAAGATTMFATTDTSAKWTRSHIPGGQLADEEIIENAGGCWKPSTLESLAGCGKSRICHPEPASFAGEGTAVRKEPRKKQIPNPVQKPNGVRNDTFSSFSAAC